MKGIDKKRFWSVLVIAPTVGLSLWIVSVPTDTLLTFVGTDNAYVFMFVIAFLGSITTFASIPYPLILIGLVAAGMDPLTTGLASAAGVVLADSCTFFVARRGRVLLSDKLQTAFGALSTKIEQYPKLLTPGIIFYGTFAPLSNDFAVISLSMMRYRYLQVIPALAVGNILYNVGLAFLGAYAYNWIVGII